MGNLTNEISKTAEGLEAKAMDKTNVETATDLGKFKDVSALYTAYKNLEAEFTRRSMKLKELEAANTNNLPDVGNAKLAPVQTENGNLHPQTTIPKEELLKAASENSEIRDAIIGEYVKSIAQSKGVPLLTTGGATVTATRNVPKTIREAGSLALKHLSNRQ